MAYVIGVAEPVSLRVRARGWGRDVAPNGSLEQAVRSVFDLTPYAIIQQLGLEAPIYADTARRGHFGRPGLPWEGTPHAEALREAVSAASNA